MENQSMEVSAIHEFLSKVEVFKDLPPQSLQIIDKRIKKMSFNKGDKIISEYERARGVFFVHSGMVKLQNKMNKGTNLLFV